MANSKLCHEIRGLTGLVTIVGVCDFLVLLVHFIVTLIRLAQPGGLRNVVAESVLIRHQLLILNRGRKRAPNLHAWDRLIAGLCTLFWTVSDLEAKLTDFQHYYNAHRTHAGLKGHPPEPVGSAPIQLCSYRWQSHCRRLYQTPVAA